MDKRKEGLSTIHLNIRKILKGRKRGLKAFEVCGIYCQRFQKLYSDSSMTARFREMKDISCDLKTYRYSLGVK